MHFYRFHVADYVSHTRHLSRMEDLAYRRMLDHAYLHERGLAGDAEAVARIIDLRDLVAEVAAVLKEFWIQDASGVWRNNRVEKELALMADKQAKAIAAGKASANARSTGVQRTFNGRSTDVEHPFNGRSTIQDSKTPRLQDTTTQDASTQEPSTEAPLRVARSSVLFPMEAPPKKLRDMTVDEVGHEPGFVKFWNAYGRKQGKRDAAKAWKAINPDEALVDEIVRCAATYAATIEPGKEQFQALPATWLNGRRWEDAPVKRAEPEQGKPQRVIHPSNMPVPYDSPIDPCYCGACKAARERKGTVKARSDAEAVSSGSAGDRATGGHGGAL